MTGLIISGRNSINVFKRESEGMNQFNPEKEELIFEIRKKDFLSFSERYLFPYLNQEYVKEEYYTDWNSIINSRDPFDKPDRKVLRQLIEVFRGGTKTLFWSIALNIYDSCTNDDLASALGSGTNPQTKEIADQLKKLLLRSPYLRYRFVPDSIAKLDEKSSEGAISTQWNNDNIVLKNGSKIYFRSLKQEWSGLHVAKIIIDDGIAKKQSKLSDEEGIRTFQYDLIPTAQSLNADIVYVGTKVRPKDLVNHIKSLGFFQVYSFPAIKDLDTFVALVNEVFLDNELDSLKGDFVGQCRWLMENQNFPFKEGKDLQEELMELCMGKKRFGWKGYMQVFIEQGRTAFMREYQLDIVKNSNSIISWPFIDKAISEGKPFKFMEKRLDCITKLVLVWDFSFGMSDNAARTSCLALWTDSRYENKIFSQLVWNVRPNQFSKWKPTLMKKIKELHLQYKADVTVPEANSILQLTDDFKSLGIPIKPVWTGGTDTTSKARINKKNFGNQISVDKNAAIERLGTAFESDLYVIVSGAGAENGALIIGEQLASWVEDEETGKIVESTVHPDAGICMVIGNEFFRNDTSQRKVVGGFIRKN